MYNQPINWLIRRFHGCGCYRPPRYSYYYWNYFRVQYHYYIGRHRLVTSVVTTSQTRRYKIEKPCDACLGIIGGCLNQPRIHASTGREWGRTGHTVTLIPAVAGVCAGSVGHRPTQTPHRLGPVFSPPTTVPPRTQTHSSPHSSGAVCPPGRDPRAAWYERERERTWCCFGETGTIDRSLPLLPHCDIVLRPTWPRINNVRRMDADDDFDLETVSSFSCSFSLSVVLVRCSRRRRRHWNRNIAADGTSSKTVLDNVRPGSRVTTLIVCRIPVGLHRSHPQLGWWCRGTTVSSVPSWWSSAVWGSSSSQRRQ